MRGETFRHERLHLIRLIIDRVILLIYLALLLEEMLYYIYSV